MSANDKLAGEETSQAKTELKPSLLCKYGADCRMLKRGDAKHCQNYLHTPAADPSPPNPKTATKASPVIRKGKFRPLCLHITSPSGCKDITKGSHRADFCHVCPQLAATGKCALLTDLQHITTYVHYCSVAYKQP